MWKDLPMSKIHDTIRRLTQNLEGATQTFIPIPNSQVGLKEQPEVDLHAPAVELPIGSTAQGGRSAGSLPLDAGEMSDGASPPSGKSQAEAGHQPLHVSETGAVVGEHMPLSTSSEPVFGSGAVISTSDNTAAPTGFEPQSGDAAAKVKPPVDGVIPIPDSGLTPTIASQSKADWGIGQAAEYLLRYEQVWEADAKGNVVVTYSFPEEMPEGKDYDEAIASTHPDGVPENLEMFSAFSPDQRTAAIQILTLWSEVANITFIPADDHLSGDIRLFNSEVMQPKAGHARAALPDSGIGGDVFINNKNDKYEHKLDPGESSYGTLLHEIGHALGLHHSGEYDGDDENGDPPTYEVNAEYAQDSTQYTVMSYFSETKTGASHDNGASTPLLFDIEAIQMAYGANYTTRSGDTVYGYGSTAGNKALNFDVYDFEDEDEPTFTIWDGGGIDTLDASGSDEEHYIDLHSGAFSDIGGSIANISIAARTVIENAVGGEDDDVLIGNSQDNDLRGGEGDDFIFGSDGSRDTFLHNYEDKDVLNGEGGDDTISGRWGDDLIFGGSGNDRLDGDAGTDFIWGGEDDDLINGGKGEDNLNGAEGDDIIYGHQGGPDNPDDPSWLHEDTDWIFGGDGNDKIFGGFGNDLIYGDSSFLFIIGDINDNLPPNLSSGVDKIYGEDGDDTIYGERDDDNLSGGNGDDTIFGGVGNDSITGDGGKDTLHGGSGDDWMSGGLGYDGFFGGSGVDTVDFTYANFDWVIDLTIEFASSSEFTAPSGQHGEAMSSIENVFLGDGLDIVFGSDVANEIWGGGGNDILQGNRGADTLVGGAGNDEIAGGRGNDLLDPGSGDDIAVDGGRGRDTVTYAWDWSGIIVDLAASSDQATGANIGTDQLSSIENVRGGEGNDELSGNDGKNSLGGLGGDDTLVGRDGDDNLYGGEGNDILRPGRGNGTVDGGDGFDTVDYSDTYMSWTINLLLSSGQATSTNGLFTQDILNVERVVMGISDDIVIGSADDNLLEGGFGNDDLSGGSGNDHLLGGANNDVLQGGDGFDLMWGDDGDDTFYFAMESEVDSAFGGSGFDVASFILGTAVQVDLAVDGVQAFLRDGADAWIETAKLSGIEGIEGSWFGDDIRGSSGDETLMGGGGDDVLESRGGINFVDGGDGTDTAIYAGDSADYDILTLKDGRTAVTFIGLEIHSDTLVNVEILSFNDGEFML